MINNFKNVCIIAPHPDDETLGLGGTIAKLIEQKSSVNVLIVGGHLPPVYKKDEYKITEAECKAAMSELGVKNIEFLKFPATTFNEIPVNVFNKKIQDFIFKINPECVFIPFPDRHIDHRVIFDGSVVACRPIKNNFPKIVLMYETLSETHWNVGGAEHIFNPDFFIDISKSIKEKVDAVNCYKSQINNNTSRSIDAVKALAKFRGSQNGCDFAEAFKTVRVVI